MGVGGEHKACSYSEFGVRALRHQGATAFLMFKIDISQNTKYATVSGFCRSGHIQFCMLRLLLTLTYIHVDALMFICLMQILCCLQGFSFTHSSSMVTFNIEHC